MDVQTFHWRTIPMVSCKVTKKVIMICVKSYSVLKVLTELKDIPLSSCRSGARWIWIYCPLWMHLMKHKVKLPPPLSSILQFLKAPSFLKLAPGSQCLLSQQAPSGSRLWGRRWKGSKGVVKGGAGIANGTVNIYHPSQKSYRISEKA